MDAQDMPRVRTAEHIAHDREVLLARLRAHDAHAARAMKPLMPGGLGRGTAHSHQADLARAEAAKQAVLDRHPANRPVPPPTTAGAISGVFPRRPFDAADRLTPAQREIKRRYYNGETWIGNGSSTGRRRR